jgi:hypothetical protein
MLNDAFLSCAQDRKDPDMLCVRARVAGDITRAFDGKVAEVRSHPGSDYAFRAWVTKDQLKAALQAAVDKIDYTNFKSSVREEDRHDAYMDIWAVMNKLQHERLRACGEQNRRNPKDTISGGDPTIAELLRSFGFNPDQPTLSDEDAKRMPPPTPRVAPYDSER